MRLKSNLRRLAAAMFAGLAVVAGCARDGLPTEPLVELTTPASPETPAPQAPPPAPPGAPSGDNRRSFVWSEETGFTILPNPPGVLLVSAHGINDDGEVAGTVIMDASAPGRPIYRGFTWSAERGFTFIVGPDGVNVQGRGINNAGDVVGLMEWGGGSAREVFLWNEREGLQPLGVPLPSLNVIGIESGQIFGNALLVPARVGTVAPFRLDLGSRRLDILPAVSEAGGGVWDVNEVGESAGYDGNVIYGWGGTSDAVMWDQSGKRTVAYDCQGEGDCFAHLASVNAQGIAVGSVTKGPRDETRVFKWSRSKGIEYLDIPHAGYAPGVAGLNDDGTILALNGQDGFLFKPSGSVTIIRAPSTHRLVQPRAMNRHGQVVGMIF